MTHACVTHSAAVVLVPVFVVVCPHSLTCKRPPRRRQHEYAEYSSVGRSCTVVDLLCEVSRPTLSLLWNRHALVRAVTDVHARMCLRPSTRPTNRYFSNFERKILATSPLTKKKQTTTTLRLEATTYNQSDSYVQPSPFVVPSPACSKTNKRSRR